jgi:hypothetical protein
MPTTSDEVHAALGDMSNCNFGERRVVTDSLTIRQPDGNVALPLGSRDEPR